MKTKNEVAIRLTEENRLEVFNLLNEFNQPMTWGVDNQLKGEFRLNFQSLIFHIDEFIGVCKSDNLSNFGNKEIVSVYELRNILAVESRDKELTESDYNDLTWYISPIDGNMFFLDKSEEYHYGFYPEFVKKLHWFNNFKENGFHTKGEWIEATEQEVCEALKKECVTRYGEDWRNVKIVAHADDFKPAVNYIKFLVVIDSFEIWNKNGVIYHNGFWAEPFKEEIVAYPEPKTHWLIRNWSKIRIAIDTINLVVLVYFGSKMVIYGMLDKTWESVGYLAVALFYAWVLRINLKK